MVISGHSIEILLCFWSATVQVHVLTHSPRLLPRSKPVLHVSSLKTRNIDIVSNETFTALREDYSVKFLTPGASEEQVEHTQYYDLSSVALAGKSGDT